MNKNPRHFSIIDKKISSIEQSMVKIFKFLIRQLLFNHPVFNLLVHFQDVEFVLDHFVDLLKNEELVKILE